MLKGGASMVIRRVREHVAAHNWFAVLVDVGIVVLGVFLGTQVNNWNEARIEGRQADEYRQRLIGDLEFDEQQYRTQLAYYRRAQAYGLDALAALKRERRLSDRDLVIAAYQLTQTDTTRAKTNSYDEMMANGFVGQVGDRETQDAISDFVLSVDVAQRSLESQLPYRSLLREVMPYALQIQIRRECGDRTVFFRGRPVGVTIVHPCPMAIDPEVAADGAARVRATPGIEQQMTRYIASIDEKLDNLEVVLDQAAALRRRLAG
jgi:hypothetical protein